MPTENELKFVLNIESESQFAGMAKNKKEIRQGYLAFSKGISVRIRDTNSEKFEICMKHKVQNRVIEIEKVIDQRDFEDLWSVSVNRLEKIRYLVYFKDKDSEKHLWEVDAFKDHHHHTYFLMAEHEMPEEQESPSFIPDMIFDNLLFAVPKEDDRFASKRLADVRHAKKLNQQLSKEKSNVSTISNKKRLQVH